MIDRSMKFFFWNINKHDLSDLIVRFILTENVDVAIFAEASEVNFVSLQNKLAGKYRLLGFNEFPGKVRFLVKSNTRAFEFMDARRYSIGTFSLGSSLINIVGVHLPDRSSDPDGSGRELAAREIMEELKERASRFAHASNVIIGDFNASPFDREMIKATNFNATLYSEVACRLKTKTYSYHEFPFMYNPTIEFISEANNNCGSFYRSNGADTYYWHCYDQAIVSPDLSKKILRYRYLRSIGDTSLIANNSPNKALSDHLPLFIAIGE